MRKSHVVGLLALALLAVRKGEARKSRSVVRVTP
jgi:hypothetical protein